MKAQPIPCGLCGARAIRTCGECRTPLCEQHARLGVDAKGQRQYLCFACDDRRYQYPPIWRGRR